MIVFSKNNADKTSRKKYKKHDQLVEFFLYIKKNETPKNTQTISTFEIFITISLKQLILSKYMHRKENKTKQHNGLQNLNVNGHLN